MQYYVCLQHTLWYTMIHNIAILYASTKWSPLNRQRDPVTPPPIPAPSPIHQSLKTINGQQHSLTKTTTQQQQHISQNNYGQQQRLQTPQTILSVVKPKIRNYIHMSWWNSEAYFKKVAKRIRPFINLSSISSGKQHNTNQKKIQVNSKIFPVWIGLNCIIGSTHVGWDNEWKILKLMIY